MKDNMIQEKKFKYDVELMNLLIKEFNFTMNDFATIFGVRRQAIDSKLKRGATKKEIRIDWSVDILEEDIIIIFHEMIKNYLLKTENEKEIYQIGCDFSLANPSFVFLYTNKENFSIKCLNKIPSELLKILLANGFHLYKQADLNKISYYRKINDSITDEGFNEIKTEDINTLKRLFNTPQEFFRSFEQFIDYFKFNQIIENKVDNRRISDEEVRGILGSFYNEELGIVKIPAEDEQYHRIVNLAANRGYNLKEFIESFGFTYRRTAILDKKKIKKNLLEILKLYMVNEDTIYINSSDKTYVSFYNRANKQGKTLTQYLKDEFSLNRIESVNSLPVGFKPFDWRSYEPNLEKEEDFIKYIDSECLLDEESNKVYIQIESPFYLRLFKYVRALDKNINVILTEWGYSRLYKLEAVQYLQDIGNMDKATEVFLGIESGQELFEAVRNKNDILCLLEDLQTELKQEKDIVQKNKRSHQLVKLLKELYGYECQMCGEDNQIPKIKMNNGYYYVEMHHIIHLSKGNAEDESSLLLDHYENAIVVCPHHHKVLHYENGGYEEIVKNESGDLFFKNERGLLSIYQNVHLKEISRVF